MPTINPCPFCGSEDVRLRGSLNTTWVYCDDCEACGPTGYGEDRKMADLSAIEKWNHSGFIMTITRPTRPGESK